MPKDSALTELIREHYPFPISHAYIYLESRVDPNDRYQAILACFEVTLKTITAIALANFVRDIQGDPALGNANLFQDLLVAVNKATRGLGAVLRHPGLKEYILVTTDKLIQMSARGLRAEVFGGIPATVFETMEEAMAHARSRTAEGK